MAFWVWWKGKLADQSVAGGERFHLSKRGNASDARKSQHPYNFENNNNVSKSRGWWGTIGTQHEPKWAKGRQHRRKS